MECHVYSDASFIRSIAGGCTIIVIDGIPQGYEYGPVKARDNITAEIVSLANGIARCPDGATRIIAYTDLERLPEMVSLTPRPRWSAIVLEAMTTLLGAMDARRSVSIQDVDRDSVFYKRCDRLSRLAAKTGANAMIKAAVKASQKTSGTNKRKKKCKLCGVVHSLKCPKQFALKLRLKRKAEKSGVVLTKKQLHAEIRRQLFPTTTTGPTT